MLLSGAGTAGAYHAGVLRALTEAGIKVDVLAAHGSGVLTALAAAVDGGPKIWDAAGPWTSPRLGRAYRWRASLRWSGAGLIACALVLVAPVLVLLAAAVLYAASEIAALANFTGLSAALIDLYRAGLEHLFHPPVLPTMLPRALVLAMLVITGVLIAAAITAARRDRSRRRWLGGVWWQLIGSPLEADEPASTLIETLWHLVRGASNDPRPTPADIGRRYVDVLTDNFGQPGFHEVIVAVHDVDSRRDVVGGVLAAPARAAFEARRAGVGPREAEIADFTGPQRALVAGFVLASCRLPIATAPAILEFPAESYWRGERHRACDRPELAMRLIDELAGIGVEQVVLVSPAPPPAAPHAMRGRPAGLRARMGELVRSVESAALADAWTSAANRFSGVFVVRPAHNPIGPFDFSGTYDESSDRHFTIAELVEQGYVDAYRHFIDPVVAAGEREELIADK